MLGHLAKQHGTAQSVTTFAQQMVTEHTAALDKAKRVANEVHVILPTTVDASAKTLFSNLSKKIGRDFDTSYIDAMVTGHEAAMSKFDEEASSGQNTAIKAYARDELPMLNDHLNLARTAQQEEHKGVSEPQKP